MEKIKLTPFTIAQPKKEYEINITGWEMVALHLKK